MRAPASAAAGTAALGPLAGRRLWGWRPAFLLRLLPQHAALRLQGALMVLELP
eukprot:CAMPEP_0180480486 /NCGR_PEP_ID=MMETSP1036_2-20121128/33855_1 /TAXON_ID=632150 /ORGANISM="Azadinium spinosum, Strain 3D9" /LENGTH=52 /DNA_ID=CAMNT_0022488111 /DNA_START=108 /DNA_END=262 /DNA_ORIENTATION=+